MLASEPTFALALTIDPFSHSLIARSNLGSNASNADFFSTQAIALSPQQAGNSLKLVGDRQDNVLRGKAGSDVILGRAGHDRLFGKAGNDRLLGHQGHDFAGGGGGADTLVGGGGNDQLNGEAGADSLHGGAGNDRLLGGTEDDTLTGGGGKDQLTGGAGRDRFVLETRSGSTTLASAAVITDFIDGEDLLHLVGASINQVQFVAGTGSHTGSTVIQERSTGKFLAVLQNIRFDAATPLIDASDFTASPSIPSTPNPPIPNPGTDPGTTSGTGTIAFSNASYRVSEGGSFATITVTRTGGTTGTVSVNYSTSDNTAKAGQDYVAATGTLIFKPGETSKSFTVAVQQESSFESAEVLRLSLSNPANGAVLGAKTKAILTIANDDKPTEAQIQGSAASQTTSGNTTVYIGYHQVSTGTDIGNQDPWMASFSNGVLNWYRDDYEITGDDSRGTHLLWDSASNRLYGAFTSTGTQGTAAEDFRRFAQNGWLRSYSDYSPGGGGGGKVAILAKIDPNTGNVSHASFLTALNGTKTNSVSVKSLAFNGSNLVVQADSAYAPRKADRTAMVRLDGVSATSPNYRVEFAPDLGSVLSAVSTNYA
ncbi:MAG: hypothetical protein Kow00121_38450 [Elainellaceae cyanobacterium]